MQNVLGIRTSESFSLEGFLKGETMLMPIREITASNFGVKSSFASDKNVTCHQAESLLEYDFLTLLEWDSRIARYATQPLTIDWIDQHGKERQYTPDVLVSYHYLATSKEAWLRPTVFEVKPYEVLQREWKQLRPKFKAAVSALRQVGIGFKIVTEKQIRTPELDNARFLLAYKTTRYLHASEAEKQMQIQIRRAMVNRGETTPKELLADLTQSDQKRILYIPWIWWLMNLGIIRTDFKKKLTMASPIWTIDTASSIPKA
jgi:hypothetical protein